jgi:transcription elongation factor S-II
MAAKVLNRKWMCATIKGRHASVPFRRPGDGETVVRVKKPVSRQGWSPKSSRVTTSRGRGFVQSSSQEIRRKARELLTEALAIDKLNIDVEVMKKLASDIEANIYRQFKGVTIKYRNRVRSRVSNLKDPQNGEFRLNVLNGHIKPEAVATMSADEMANKQMRSLRKHLARIAAIDNYLASNLGTSSDLVTCPRCRKKNCCYNQSQTLRADEPMTTFCHCNICDFRWKFN